MFTIREVSREEIVLEVKGVLNGACADEFQRNLDELMSSPHKTVTLKLSDVESINSSSIGKILLCRKKLAEEGRTIRVRGCSESLYNTFQLIKFDKLISIEP